MIRLTVEPALNFVVLGIVCWIIQGLYRLPFARFFKTGWRTRHWLRLRALYARPVEQYRLAAVTDDVDIASHCEEWCGVCDMRFEMLESLIPVCRCVI